MCLTLLKVETSVDSLGDFISSSSADAFSLI